MTEAAYETSTVESTDSTSSSLFSNGSSEYAAEAEHHAGDNMSAEPSVNDGESNENAWYLADGIPGSGDKPSEFNDGTFKTVNDQLKAHKELQKHLKGFTGAPDEYQLNLKEDFADLNISQEDPLLTAFAKHAKESNMSQKMFDDTVNMFVEQSLAIEKEAAATIEQAKNEEITKLGENAQEQLKELHQWAVNNFTDDQVAAFENLVQTADDVRFFQALRSKTGGTNLVGRPQEAGRPAMTREQLQERNADPRNLSDPTFAAETRKMYADNMGDFNVLTGKQRQTIDIG